MAEDKLPALRNDGSGLRMIGNLPVQVDQVYFEPAVHPKVPGPWSIEPDKIAWIDPLSGLACIILRSAVDGHLGGYVGVGPESSLYGYSHSALTHAYDINVHGGLGYSAVCEPGPESRTVCHVSEAPSARPHVGMVDAHDRQWWFGFSADQPYDLVPNPRRNQWHKPMPQAPDDALTRPRAYRDEAYMHAQCTALAGQIHAIENGQPLPASGLDIPPIALNPSLARRG